MIFTKTEKRQFNSLVQVQKRSQALSVTESWFGVEFLTE